ncbi:efflux RND transporter periplasmic adaptor subunit [Vulcaniibacterium thermophilum]|uniref:Hemolysin D n=1 Tax=Vulcaniibacterium thermophilum TaxID=1169913 RepID=A0A918YV59_9GAMM|nr:efflux RND transporter periplasmic adaptor subunit [Vulcaniibacterium thermophilum]GHE26229.1 hemolysin D [Vulcaniibacterium thermophilum]
MNALRPLARHPIVVALGASLLLLATGNALLRRQADATPTPPAPPAPAVSVAEAERVRFAPRQWVPGSVIGRQDARVASEFGGRVVRVAEVGQAVRAGDALAVLDDTGIRLRAQEAQAELGRIRAQLELATSQERRYAALAAQQNVARSQLDQLRAERSVLAQELARAQATLAQVRHQQQRMVVRAPFDGVVAERIAQPGEFLAPGGAIARLVDLATREVQVRAPVDLASHLGVGTPVLLRAAGPSGSAAATPLRVSALVPVGDAASRQLELRIALPSAGAAAAWPIGSAVDVGLPRGPQREVVAVPRDALVLRREGDYVLRVGARDVAERVGVEAGDTVDGQVEVRGDVRPGDRLIVRGAERVQPGQTVRVLAAAPLAQATQARAAR